MKYGITILCFSLILMNGCTDKEAPSLRTTLQDAVIDYRGKTIDADDLLGTDYLLLYFSAHWCGPCRSFTPNLVRFYNEKKGGHLFQVLFVSSDKSEAEMHNYIQETRMPWPAVPYRSEARNMLKQHYGGPGIPQLVLFDQDGNVIADSFKDKKYLGPQHVLSELDKRIAGQLEKQKADQAELPESPIDDKFPPDQISGKFKINGFAKTKNQYMAFVNGKVVMEGQSLDKDIRVEKITDTYMEVSCGDRHYRLKP